VPRSVLTGSPTIPQHDGEAGKSSLASAHPDATWPPSRAILFDFLGHRLATHISMHDRFAVTTTLATCTACTPTHPLTLKYLGAAITIRLVLCHPLSLDLPTRRKRSEVNQLPAISLLCLHAVSSLAFTAQIACLCENQTRPCVLRHQQPSSHFAQKYPSGP